MTAIVSRLIEICSNPENQLDSPNPHSKEYFQKFFATHFFVSRQLPVKARMNGLRKPRKRKKEKNKILRRNEMKNMNLKKAMFGLVSSFMVFGIFMATQTFAAVERAMVLQGGATASTETSVLIHNALPITVRFTVKRDGSDNNFAQRRVRFQLISPNGATESVIRSIGGANEVFTLQLPAAGGGNNVRNWRATMQNFESASAAEVNQPVRGTAEFFTTGTQTATIPAPAKFGLVQSGSATKTISMPFTGDLKIQANWDTDELTIVNFRLKFELYKGNTLLASDTGYSRDSIILGISDSQRMKISYRVKASDFQIPGDWKVKVYGSTSGKVKNIDLKMSIADGLF
jgi:hypothetical protein